MSTERYGILIKVVVFKVFGVDRLSGRIYDIESIYGGVVMK